jgi:hypothetical protein
MTQQEQDRKRKNIERGVKILAAGVVCFLAAPFVYIAIGGLIGLLIFGGIVTATSFIAPVVARKAANWRLGLIKAEAAKNPIETLQNDYAKQAQQLDAFGDRLTTFNAEIQNFQTKLGTFRKKYSAEEAKVFDEQLAKMKKLLELRTKNFQSAVQELSRYALEIQKADAIWKMGQAAAAMTKAAGMTEDDFFDKISRETALDSVQTNLNKSFAELDLSFAEESAVRPDETSSSRELATEKQL